MRTPGKPRKPTPLSHGRIDERSGGGESVAPQLPDYTQDYVPTAAVDPIDVADYAQDDLAQIDHDYSFSEEPIELSERYLERRAERRRIRFKRFFTSELPSQGRCCVVGCCSSLLLWPIRSTTEIFAVCRKHQLLIARD